MLPVQLAESFLLAKALQVGDFQVLAERLGRITRHDQDGYRRVISPVAVNRASVLHRSPLLAVGCCCCCHRCCQLTLSGGGQRVTKVPRRHGGYWATLNMPRHFTTRRRHG